MSGIRKFFTGLGMAVYIIAGIIGFILCLSIITKAAGFWGLVAAFFLAPVTFLAAPFYAGFAWHNWWPLALNYGAVVIAGICFYLGEESR